MSLRRSADNAALAASTPSRSPHPAHGHTFALLLLSFASIASLSQALSSPQEKLNLHSRMAQQYLEEQRPELAVPEFQAIIAL